MEEADLRLIGFSIWIFGRQFPDATDYWDGNWLNVRVRFETAGAVVETQGPIIRTDEIGSFSQQLKLLDTTLKGNAILHCMEPNLNLTIHADNLGQMTVKLAITPDHLTQSHEFLFGIDQSYLKPLLAKCQAILIKYPIRGTLDELASHQTPPD